MYMDNVQYWGKAQPATSKKSASFEDRLSDIVVRVEKSGWTDEDKEALYAKISEYLRDVALPVITKYMPANELHALASSSSKVTIDTYIEFMKKPYSNPEMYKELYKELQSVLDDVDTALSKGGIL